MGIKMTYQEAQQVFNAYYDGTATRAEFDDAMVVINGNVPFYDAEAERIDHRRAVRDGWKTSYWDGR
jgi:hypothetical protein